MYDLNVVEVLRLQYLVNLAKSPTRNLRGELRPKNLKCFQSLFQVLAVLKTQEFLRLQCHEVVFTL